MTSELAYPNTESPALSALKSAASATARLEARITTQLHALLKRACEIQGRTMTDFVVATMTEAAHKTIQEAEVMRLSLADQMAFAQAIINPPKPNAALLRAVDHHKQLLGHD